ncbi:OB-fold-containig protein [Labrys wisconsinensis]|uniref:Membrane protein implicated in regulation of membrane protease activity n=1 Tax=Labrys wisconsinensis TaxID=425677 RepID=A0ABU0J6A6_9HYPH|nr:OB-fold-containig protein [Labrys wisconsinensis]MDQ0469797.1 membrane protein implicated in regulation of membrane protease activity [Labrys wisconsinensis]
MDLLLTPETKPFGIAALILCGLVAIELAGLIIGISASSIIDKGFGGHVEGHPGAHPEAHEGWLGGILGWINPGRAPILIVMMLALGAFAASGYAIQSVAIAWVGALPALAASAVAAVAALLLTRAGSRLVARLIPRDETYAVDEADLVGLTASVVIGPLDGGKPGRVRVQDRYGNWHFLNARAADGHGPFAQGRTVLLADCRNNVFIAITATDDLAQGR